MAGSRVYSREAVASIVGDTIIVDPTIVKDLLGFIQGENPDTFWGLRYARNAVRNTAKQWLLTAHPSLRRLLERPVTMQAEVFVARSGLPSQFRVTPRPHCR